MKKEKESWNNITLEFKLFSGLLEKIIKKIILTDLNGIIPKGISCCISQRILHLLYHWFVVEDKHHKRWLWEEDIECSECLSAIHHNHQYQSCYLLNIYTKRLNLMTWVQFLTWIMLTLVKSYEGWMIKELLVFNYELIVYCNRLSPYFFYYSFEN